MNFKNALERKCFEAAERALGSNVAIEHNKTIEIENGLSPEVAAFKGPPKKEIDVIVANLLDNPRIILLVSCKLLSGRAEPAHVQEWAAVVSAMNRYSRGTTYFGLVLSPTGFTNGCESWATSHNLGLVPPLKGRRLSFNEDTVLRMLERVLGALRARVRIRSDDLTTAPTFFDFVFRLTADFEGHQEATAGARYFLRPQNWVSSFGEMYAAVAGKYIEDLCATADRVEMVLCGGIRVRFDGRRVEYGAMPPGPDAIAVALHCRKNLDMEDCDLDEIKAVAVGKTISSAGDFGDYIEYGLDQRFNLGLRSDGLHLFSIENPVDEHRL